MFSWLSIHANKLASAQTHDQKTSLAGNIARACAVFCVDEIVIFSDTPNSAAADDSFSCNHGYNPHSAEDAASGYTAFSDPANFLEHVLSYLETPPHLRRTLFPHHPNLRTAGKLQSVDMPHHLKQEEWCQYREGVSNGPAQPTHRPADEPSSKISKADKKNKNAEPNGDIQYSSINTGLPNPVTVPVAIPPHARVTVRFDESEPPASSFVALTATAVSPAAPREDLGYYWGYTVRQAESLSAVFTESPWPGGYDFCIGTSERGATLDEFFEQHPSLAQQQKTASSDTDEDASDADESAPQLRWTHLLLTFGGVAGLEKALAHDTVLQAKGVADPKDLFDAYINLVPQQGSRTIRTEEALWCGLMGLRGWVLGNGV